MPFPWRLLILPLILASGSLLAQEGHSEPKPSFPPSPEAVKKARESVRDILKPDYARRGAKDREALARRLLRLAQDTKNDRVMQAALFLETRDVASQAGDVETALTAMKELAAANLDADRKSRLDALEGLAKAARTKEAAGTVAAACLALADEAADQGEYDVADRAAGAAETAAKGARDADLLGRAREARDAVREQKREYAKVEASIKKLAENPADPEANLAAGKFLCFARNDWVKGLPMLSRGSDARLVEIADKETSDPKDPKARAELGDLWWAWSEKTLAQKERLAGQSRAVKWYEEAVPKLNVIDKARAEKRIQAYYDAATAQAGGAVEAGNVALAKNGTTASGAAIIRPEELIDGVTTGHTNSTGYAYSSWPCEWIVTLPRPYLLRQIRLLLWDGENRFYRYALETSPDGRAYMPLVDRSQGEWKSWQTVSFPPRRVKTVKVKGVYNSANSQFHVVELEAYCVPPLAPAVPRERSPEEERRR